MDIPGAMTFGEALAALKSGEQVARRGWNGKGMWLFMVGPWNYLGGEDNRYPRPPFIAMKTADDKVVPWLASQTDMLASDWVTVD